ncbi:Probable RNA-directed DNA polymerase from transposon BS [Anthophora quadrimaculata]
MSNFNSHTDSVKILYWNSRSIRRRLPEIQSVLSEVDILICVESWLSPVDKLKFSGFNVYRKDRTYSSGGGILIAIRKNFIFSEIENILTPDQSVEICGIRLLNLDDPLDLVVCYRSPGSTLSQLQWNSVVCNLSSSHGILIGDFNAHNKSWNCRLTDPNGSRLENASQHKNLFLHNENALTHLDAHSSLKSNLDLVFSTLDIADKIEVTVSDETWGSDHYPIFVKVNISKHLYTKHSFKLKTIRTDWDNFRVLLEEDVHLFSMDEYLVSSPSSKYKTFVDVIVQALCLSTLAKKRVPYHRCSNPVPWWDKDCDRIKRLRRAALKKWEHSLDLEDLIHYKKICAEAIKLFKTKKRECFKRFAASIDFQTDPGYVWNQCKSFKNSWVKVNPQHCSSNLRNPSHLESAFNKLCPPWVETDVSWFPPSRPNEFFDSVFTLTEIHTALISKSPSSAPGTDGIDFDIIKKLPNRYIAELLNIFNAMYIANDFPVSWKDSFVIFISKSDGMGLRPISFTSCFCKLLETMVKNRLQWWVETNGFLPSNQHGFRKGKSCIDNLAGLALKVDEAFLEKKVCYCCLFRRSRRFR